MTSSRPSRRVCAGNPIFVGGVPRSGTTLLRVILDTHSRIYCGTEVRVVQALTNLWSAASQSAPLLSQGYGVDAEALRNVFANLLESFLEPAWRASGKARVAEKTPWNLLVFPELRTLFPASPLIHVIRDGRDVVASRLQRDKADGDIDTVAFAAMRAQEWVDAMALRSRMVSDERLSACYFELRYEQLINQPRQVLGPLFEFLAERFEPDVLDFHRTARDVDGSEEWSAEAVRRPLFTTSCGRWRTDLSKQEQAAVMKIAEAALQDLGYRDG